MLSVIVPTLNEAVNIGSLLDQLSAQQHIELDVIVVDGGSSDDTCRIVDASPARLLKSAAGRGRQMNVGAAAANMDWLLFLHADSKLTSASQLIDAMTYIQTIDGIRAGHFAIQFDTDNPETKKSLAFFEAKTGLNRPGTFNGDQGLLISAEHFDLLGRFAENRPFLEDQDFGRRFIERGRFVTLPSCLTTSARRFEEEGLQERIFLNAIIMGMFTLGHDGFFDRAPGIYRHAADGDRLDLLPFFRLVRSSLFDRGPIVGIWRCCQIGQYASRNSWQLMLLRGLKTGGVKEALGFFDRYISPVANSPLGGLVGTAAVVTWFFFIELRLRFAER